MTRATGDQLRSYLTKVLPSSDLDELVSETTEFESMVEGAATRGMADATPDRVKRVAEKLARGSELDPNDQFVTEAIIIPDKRPAIDIQKGDYKVVHELWTHFDTDAGIKQRLRTAIKSIGRVELPNHPTLPYGGTAFVVGPDLLMTNRHVAELFTSGLGLRGLRFRPGLSAGIDFLRERDRDDSISVGVRTVLLIHPFWDMAILKVEGLGADQKPLRLALDAVEDLEGSDIAVIGYPAFDPRNDAAVQNTVFGGVYNVKRMQPGKLGARRRVMSFQNQVFAATHDSSTLGGNSGSAVVAAASGQIVALHFGGLYLDANFSVPASELAIDGRVVDTGVVFAGQPSPRPDAYANAWREADLDEAAAAAAGSSAASGSSLAFTAPLTITISIGKPS